MSIREEHGTGELHVLGHSSRTEKSSLVSFPLEWGPMSIRSLSGGWGVGAVLLNRKEAPAHRLSGTQSALDSAIQQLCDLPGDDTDVVAVAFGKAHGLALTSGGRVFAFGENQEGQCGVGHVRSPILAPTLVAKFDQRRIVAIACGAAHSLVLSDQGDVYAWGRGAEAQLGTGAAVQTTPSYVRLNFLVSSIACGAFFSTVVSVAGTAYFWGTGLLRKVTKSPTALQLDALESKLDSHNEAPVVREAVRVTSLACGYGHMALVTADGGVHTLGLNTMGQTGTGPSGAKQQDSPVRLAAFGNAKAEMTGLLTAVDVTCGQFSTAVLASDGTIWSFGSGSGGQLGHGSDDDMLQPKRVEDLAGLRVTQVALSNNGMIAFAPTCITSVVPTCIPRQGEVPMRITAVGVRDFGESVPAYVSLQVGSLQRLVRARVLNGDTIEFVCPPLSERKVDGDLTINGDSKEIDEKQEVAATPGLIQRGAEKPDGKHGDNQEDNEEEEEEEAGVENNRAIASRASSRWSLTSRANERTFPRVMVVARTRPFTESELQRDSRGSRSSKSATTVNNTKSGQPPVALFLDPLRSRVSCVNPRNGQEFAFEFDRCLPSHLLGGVTDPSQSLAAENATDEVLFKETSPFILQQVWDGRNCCVMGYGPSGTGKTHSLYGTTHASTGKGAATGLVPCTMTKLFSGIEKRRLREPNVLFVLSMSMFEIAGEQVYDLLAKTPKPKSALGATTNGSGSGTKTKSLRVRSLKGVHSPVSKNDSDNGVYVDGLEERAIPSAADFHRLLQRGREEHRSRCAKEQRRSHVFVRVIVERQRRVKSRALGAVMESMAAQRDDKPRVERLNGTFVYGDQKAQMDSDLATSRVVTECRSRIDFVDLAGGQGRRTQQQSATATVAEIQRAQKAEASVGKALMAIRDCFSAIHHNSAVKQKRDMQMPPFRDSLVTLLTQDCLAGSGCLCLLATVSPSLAAFEESLLTLKYANLMRATVVQSAESPCSPSPMNSARQVPSAMKSAPLPQLDGLQGVLQAAQAQGRDKPHVQAYGAAVGWAEEDGEMQSAEVEQELVEVAMQKTDQAHEVDSDQTQANISNTAVSLAISMTGTHFSKPVNVAVYEPPSDLALVVDCGPSAGGCPLALTGVFSPLQGDSHYDCLIHFIPRNQSSAGRIVEATFVQPTDGTLARIECLTPPHELVRPFRSDSEADSAGEHWTPVEGRGEMDLSLSLDGVSFFPTGLMYTFVDVCAVPSSITPSWSSLSPGPVQSGDDSGRQLSVTVYGLHKEQAQHTRIRFVSGDFTSESVAVSFESTYDRNVRNRLQRVFLRKELREKRALAAEEEAAEKERMAREQAEAEAEASAALAAKDKKATKAPAKAKPKTAAAGKEARPGTAGSSHSKASKGTGSRPQSRAGKSAGDEQEKAEEKAEEDRSPQKETLDIDFEEPEVEPLARDLWSGEIKVPLPWFGARCRPGPLNVEVSVNDGADFVLLTTLELKAPQLVELVPNCGPVTGGTVIEAKGTALFVTPNGASVATFNQVDDRAWDAVDILRKGEVQGNKEELLQNINKSAEAEEQKEISATTQESSSSSTADVAALYCQAPPVPARGPVQFGLEIMSLATNTLPFTYYDPVSVETLKPDKGTLSGGLEVELSGVGIVQVPTSDIKVRLTITVKGKKGKKDEVDEPDEVHEQVVVGVFEEAPPEDTSKKAKKRPESGKAKKGKAVELTEEQKQEQEKKDMIQARSPAAVTGTVKFITPAFPEELKAGDAVVELALNGQQYVKCPKPFKYKGVDKKK